MTPTERQQSLINARRACEMLRRYAKALPGDAVPLWVTDLIAGFEILDEKELRQAEAGRQFGHLGKEHGSKGGRPRKGKQGNGSHSYKTGDYEITQMADNSWQVYLSGEDTGRNYPTLREARRVLYDEIGGWPKGKPRKGKK